MKTINICERDAGAQNIKRYFSEIIIEENMTFSLAMSLSIGNIKTDRTAFLKNLYQSDSNTYKKALKKITEYIPKYDKIRIWSSKSSTDDYLLLLFLCDYLKEKTTKISVIFSDDYKNVKSIDALYYKEINNLLQYEKNLSEQEIKLFSNQWRELVEKNSDLRVLDKQKVKCQKYSDYYNQILDILTKISPCRVVTLITNCMIKDILNNAGDTIYLMLINQLIELNKIKIIKKAQNHLQDIIEKRRDKMQNIEVEMKYKITEEIYKKIIAFMKKEKYKAHEEYQNDIYFSPIHFPFFGSEIDNECLRIRIIKDKNILSYKKFIPATEEEPAHSIEHEIEINDLESMKLILNDLRIKEMFTLKKERKIFSYKYDIEISLDKVESLGYFIELEVKNKEKIKESIQEIKEFIKKFNITEEMRNYDGYSYLLYNQSITE